ncbi:MAG TPA: hypothetical protein VFZ54_11130 [Burkholderiales bacterium]
MRAQQVEQRALAVAEIAPRAVQHEADEQPVAHVDRQRERVVDAHSAVVLVVERAPAEFGERHRVADALRHAAALVAVETHQRVLMEVPVEGGALVGAERARGQAVNLAPPARQVTDRERGELGGHQPRQALDAGAREGGDVARGLLHRAEQL